VKASEKEAPPGPGAYELKFDYVEKKGKGYSFGKPSKESKTLTDEKIMLYPSIDATRPNLHAAKAVMKKPVYQKAKSPEQVITLKERSKSPAAKKGEGIAIAPEKYSRLTEEELERLLWYQLYKNPHLYIEKRHLKVCGPGMEQVSYKAVEKNPRAPKIVDKKTQPRRALEKELEMRYRPDVFTYSPDDRKIKNRLPLYTIPQGRRGDRTPSPDRKKVLIVDVKAIKKNARKVAILPEHNVTDK